MRFTFFHIHCVGCYKILYAVNPFEKGEVAIQIMSLFKFSMANEPMTLVYHLGKMFSSIDLEHKTYLIVSI